jgi:hypothetical protein
VSRTTSRGYYRQVYPRVGAWWLLDGVLAAVGAGEKLTVEHADPAWTAEVDRLLRGATAIELVRLETAYRARRLSMWRVLGLRGPRHHRHEVDDIVLPDGAARTAVLALASFDRSGLLREAAVRELARMADDFVLPFLLLRLNDVVSSVQAMAAQACRRWLVPEHARVVVQVLPLIEGLDNRRRAGEFARTVREALAHGGDATRAALWSAARTGDPAVRASNLRILAMVEPVEVVRYVFTLREPALRRWGARLAVSRTLAGEQQHQLLPLLENDSNARIRFQALRARARFPDSEPYLRRAVLDPDVQVRYLARRTLWERGQPVSRETYRYALEHPTGVGDLIGALAGLSDVGTVRDLDRVLPLLAHPRTRVRAEACRTVAILDPDAMAARVEQLRRDPSAKVRRFLPPTGEHRPRSQAL